MAGNDNLDDKGVIHASCDSVRRVAPPQIVAMARGDIAKHLAKHISANNRNKSAAIASLRQR